MPRGRDGTTNMLGIIFRLAFVVAVTFGSDVVVTRRYRYETSVVVDEDCSGDGHVAGHRLEARVLLTDIRRDSQHKLVKIQISEPRLLATKKSEFERRGSELERTATPESFFLLRNGRVEKFWDSPGEHPGLRNLKRSVASLLQVDGKDGEQTMDVVSGRCGVRFKIEGDTVRRSIGNCRHPVPDSVPSLPFGVRSSTVHQSTVIDCDVKEGMVSKCTASERLKTFSSLWRKPSICIHSTSGFTLEGTSDGKESMKGMDYGKVLEEIKKKADVVEGNLYSVAAFQEDPVTANILDSTKSFQESLKSSNLAKLKSASAFFKLLPMYKAASKEDILKVLETKKFVPILPQILDLVAASSSRDAVGAAIAYFSRVEDYDQNMERYLISLSVLPRPQNFVLTELKSLSEKRDHHEKIQATLFTTLGALLRTYARNSDGADLKVVEEVLDYLEKSLEACKTEACVLSCLRGLRNAAQPPSIPLLLRFALNGGKPALEALLAIRNMPPSHLSRHIQELLQKVFHGVGVRQDSSSRAVAADILLRGRADDDILASILGSLSDQSDKEFSSLIVSKVFKLMDEDKVFRSRISRLLPEKEISHYYSLSQNGKSSLFKRQLMSADGLNVTYGIEMELLEGGLLKRSSFDVEFETDSEVSNMLSVGMFAEGMSSLAGESSGDDVSDPSAGMELTLLGTSLRPYVFFTGTTELMGHAWSGTASEPTPALQGIFPLIDDTRPVVLHNGMLARLELRGAMSTDLSASVQISLWNRNSQSQVKNSAALLVKASAVVDVGTAKTRGEYLFYGQSSIDFDTDLEFSEAPFKMCLQMDHPDIVIKHDFQSGVEVSETKFSSKKTKRRRRFIPGRSYALHQNNNELCRIMKGSDSY